MDLEKKRGNSDWFFFNFVVVVVETSKYKVNAVRIRSIKIVYWVV